MNSWLPDPLRGLTRDAALLFATRVARLFAYGFVSVVLVLYLHELGFSDSRIGLLLTLTLVGDTAVSLWITTHADRLGRRRMLLAGSALMLLAGIAFVLTRDYLLLVVAATVGVISPTGNEVGPFLPIEQAALSQTITEESRTAVFAWYSLAGSLATAAGALAAGGLAQGLRRAGLTALGGYRAVVLGYAAAGVVLGLLFRILSPATEAPTAESGPTTRPTFGLHRSHGVVARLAALFALDAFGGGFVLQSLVAYWFHLRFGVEPALLGGIFFGANLLAGLSALLAARLASRFGLLNTMVFTHIPSNVLLLLVPLMPTLPLAITVLLLRFSISQMDVPTRQSYLMAVVRADERSAAAGVTGVARTTGAAISPALAGPLFASRALMDLPFLLAGGLKILYDLLLYVSFRAVRPDRR